MATTERFIVNIQVQGQEQLQSAKTSLNNLEKGFGIAAIAGKAFVGILAAEKVLQFAGALKNVAGEFQQYNNQLKLITNGQSDLNDTFAKLRNAAVANRAPLGETIDLYTKLKLATESLGKSNDEILEVTGKFQKALAISGADANTAAGAIRQFGQAMASGTVRGDEFNSIVEALGPALSIMAKESGLNVGTLRELSQSGKLTAEVFFEMVKNSQALEMAFNSGSKTISQYETELGDALKVAVNQFLESTGAADGYTNAIANLARTLRYFTDSQTDVEKATDEQLLSWKNSQEALDEYTRRYPVLIQQIDQANKAGVDFRDIFSNLFGKRDQAEEVNRIRTELQRLSEEQKRLGDETKKRIEEQGKAQQKAMSYLKEELALVDQYAKNQQKALPPLQALNQERDKAAAVVEKLKSQIGEEGTANLDLANKLKVAEAEVVRLDKAKKELLESGKNLQGFDKYYFDLIKGAKDAAEQTDFQQKALVKLQQEYDATGQTSAVLKQAIDDLTSAMAKQQQGFPAFYADLISETEKAAQSKEYLRLTIEKLNQDIATNTGNQEVNRAALAKATEQYEKLNDTSDSYNKYLENLIKNEREATKQKDYAIRAITDLEKKYQDGAISLDEYEAARKRAFNEANLVDMRLQTDWAKGFQAQLKQLTKEIPTPFMAAQRVTASVFQAMENAIFRFITTGKLSFKDFANAVIAEIARIAARAAATKILGGLAGFASTAFAFFSDEGMKKNVKPLSSNRPDGLNLYEFEYKDQYKDIAGYGKQVGFMAQEVERIYPEAVGRDAKTGKKTVDYSKITGSKIRGFANGGTPNPNELILVGENGPELFVPNTAGEIVSNDEIEKYMLEHNIPTDWDAVMSGTYTGPIGDGFGRFTSNTDGGFPGGIFTGGDIEMYIANQQMAMEQAMLDAQLRAEQQKMEIEAKIAEARAKAEDAMYEAAEKQREAQELMAEKMAESAEKMAEAFSNMTPPPLFNGTSDEITAYVKAQNEKINQQIAEAQERARELSERVQAKIAEANAAAAARKESMESVRSNISSNIPDYTLFSQTPRATQAAPIINNTTPQVYNITYNINAIDARSFQELIASDPEFIFSVTEQGRVRLGY